MNPLQPNVFAQHSMTYGNVDPSSGMKTTQTGSSARPTALPLPASVNVGPLTLHIGRLVTTLPENEIRLLHSALDASAAKALLTGSPTADGLCSYHIQPKDHVASLHLPSQLSEKMLVSFEFDHAMNIKQMLVGSVQGKIYCQAYFEPAAMADQALAPKPKRATPIGGGPQQTSLTFPTAAARAPGEPGVNRTSSTHAARTGPYPNAKPDPLSTRARDTPPNQAAVTHRDEQLRKLLHHDDGTLRTTKEAKKALFESPLTATHDQFRQMLRDAGARINLPGASEEDIVKRLYADDNCTLRSTDEVLKVLHADGLGSNHSRITRLRKEAKGEKE
jgi:hypothetical protein